MIHLHSTLRWAVIILALLTLVKSYVAMSKRKSWEAKDKKPALFFMISMDIQLLIGLILYFTGAWGLKNIQNAGMGTVMKDPVGRFYAVEHLVGMLLAVVCAHIAYAFTKKSIDDQVKYKKIFRFTLLSIILILLSIPWPFREGLGRALFPGM